MDSRTLRGAEGGRPWVFEVTWDGCEVEVAEGPQGGETEVQQRAFGTPMEAREFIDEQIAARLGRGYREADGGEVSAAAATGPASNPDLELLIEADPDSLEPYLVYADWLQARAEPRGELIVVQSQGLDEVAAALISSHAPRLLGTLGEVPHLVELTWHLGFVHAARMFVRDVATEGLDDGGLLRSFLGHPSARVLRRLVLHRGPNDVWSDRDLGGLVAALLRQPRPTLVALQIGHPDHPSEIALPSDLWPSYPGLEELALFGRLRPLPPGGGTLRELTLVSPDDGDAVALLRGLAMARWPSLEVLRLRLPRGDLAPLTALLGPAATPRLRHLDLGGAPLTGPLVRALVHSGVLGRIQQLSVEESDQTLELLRIHRSALSSRVSVVLHVRPYRHRATMEQGLGITWADTPWLEPFRFRFPGQEEQPGEDEEQDGSNDDDEQIYGYAEEGDDYWRGPNEVSPDHEPAVDEGWDDLAKEGPYDLDET